MQKELRNTFGDICLGDKFLADNGLVYDIVRFQTESHVFCECGDEKFDSYFFRDENLKNMINDYFVKGSEKI